MFGKTGIGMTVLAFLLLAACGSTKNNRFGNRVQKTGKQAKVKSSSKPQVSSAKRRAELQGLDFLGGESTMDKQERRQKARMVEKADKQKQKEAGLTEKKPLSKKQKKAMAKKRKEAIKRHMDMQDKATQKRMKRNLRKARGRRPL